MRIGFIGAGGIAQLYLRSLQRLEQPVVSVCDTDEERAVRAAAQYEAQPYTDYREMLQRQRLDAVFVAIPPAAHMDEVADVARAGAAVFVAKPVALDLDTALRTRQVLEETGVINQAGYMARYADITEWARDLVRERDLTVGFGRFICRMSPLHPWWGKGAVSGGQLIEQSTHVFDLLRYFMGEVETAQAFGHQGGAEDVADFADSTVCNLRFRSGAVGSVVSSCLARATEGFGVEFVGRDVHLRLSMDLHLTGMLDGAPVEYTGEESGYFRQIEHFLRAVRTRDDTLVRSTYADAVRTLAVTLAATRSLESGAVEALEPVRPAAREEPAAEPEPVG